MRGTFITLQAIYRATCTGFICLLIEALEFAKQHITIKSKDTETIFHARKSLLYKEGEPWIKKQSNNFNVTMGSYDGVEVCELIGIFKLSLIGNKYNLNNIGLYGDDRLAVFKNTSGPQSGSQDFSKSV